MNNIKSKKRFVINNNGYTLLEALMSLFVLGIVIFSLLNFLNVVKTNTDNNYNFKEASLFFSQIQEDFLQSKEVILKNSKELDMVNYKGQEIKYKYDKNRLVRQKDNKGYQIMLNNVRDLNFYIQKELIYMQIKFEDSKKVFNWVLNVSK